MDAPGTHLPPVCLITDGGRTGEERLLDAIERAVRGGLRMIQVRERHLGDDAIETLVARIRRLVPPQAILVVNRRGHLVDKLRLAGVHVGGDLQDIPRARRSMPAGALVGFSAHTPEEVRSARDLGADYASFSPVFDPISKRSPLPAAGLERLRQACGEAALPVFALGGITALRLPDVRRAGAAGVSVIGAILDAADPENAARELLRGWEDAADKP